MSEPESVTLMAFAKSLWRGERADNYFKFLKERSEKDVDLFFQGLLRTIGDAIDDQDITLLTHFVQQQQVYFYQPTQTPGPVRLDYPDAPFAPLRKPLREATIALFTSGAIYRDDQQPFHPADMTYEEAMRNDRMVMERVASLRVIPMDTPVERLRAGHVAYDIRAAQKDINVMLPLTCLRELAQQGVIGAVAEHHYSFQGLTNIQRLRDETAPQWAQMLKEAQVDAVFLTPGCPICHVTVGYLARAIENVGIPTVCVYVEAFKRNAQLIKPPRVLLTPHPMGRPIGLPHDRARQLAVTRTALHLLELADHPPILMTFVPESSENEQQETPSESMP